MEKGKSPKITLCAPFNFEGDELHLNFLKNTQFVFGSSFVTHITYYDKVPNILNGHEMKIFKVISRCPPPGQRPCSYINRPSKYGPIDF